MKRNLSLALIVLAATLSGCVTGKPVNDPSLVGSWKGQRDENGKCRFMSWKNQFNADGTFAITFFRDAKQTQQLQTEHGTWAAANGKNVLKTNGVAVPDVYTYTFKDADTVHYVNVEKGPSADCQEDYEFDEHRVRG